MAAFFSLVSITHICPLQVLFSRPLVILSALFKTFQKVRLFWNTLQLEHFHFWVEQISQVWQAVVLFMLSHMVCVFFTTVENISQQGKSLNINVHLHDMQ